MCDFAAVKLLKGFDLKIQRVVSDAKGRSDAVSFNGLAYVVAYDPNAASGIEAQTRNSLQEKRMQCCYTLQITRGEKTCRAIFAAPE